jgi:hypothetical protein
MKPICPTEAGSLTSGQCAAIARQRRDEMLSLDVLALRYGVTANTVLLISKMAGLKPLCGKTVTR